MQYSLKTFILFLTSVMLVAALQLQSCKKTSTTPPPPPPPPNYVCDGNGQANYMPLKTGYIWEYYEQGFGSSSNTVNQTKVIGGKTYFEVKYLSAVDNINGYYRIDSVGNIDKYNVYDLAEYMYIPINPTVGQIIATYQSGESRKVVGINESLSTGTCSYTGLLKIDELTSTGSNLNTYYYKKGLGEVQEMGFFAAIKLTKVTF